MLQNIFTEEENFQPYLLGNDYTFIGPVDQSLFKPFFLNANHFAPVVAISRTIHHFLSHKESIKKAVALLPLEFPQNFIRGISSAGIFVEDCPFCYG